MRDGGFRYFRMQFDRAVLNDGHDRTVGTQELTHGGRPMFHETRQRCRNFRVGQFFLRQSQRGFAGGNRGANIADRLPGGSKRGFRPVVLRLLSIKLLLRNDAGFG